MTRLEGFCIFALVGCQPLHAWFPQGLRVFSATSLDAKKPTEGQRRCGNLPTRAFRNQMEKLFLSLTIHLPVA